MKKHILGRSALFCAGLGLCVVLSSCIREEAGPSATPNPVPTPTVHTPSPTATPAPAPKVTPTPTDTPAVLWTEEDAYAAFQAATETAGITGWAPTGCAVADDGFAGLGAVVLYTDEERDTACNLAFVYADGGFSVNCFAPNETDGVRSFDVLSAPAYMGEGCVAVDVQENGGTSYRFTVCSSTEGWDDFTVSSEPLS